MNTRKTGLAIALAALFSAACAGAPETANQNRNATATPATANANQPPAQASTVDAAALYRSQLCAGCHGIDGKGVVKDSRNFTDPAWQKIKSDEAVAESIKNGAPPAMPAYKDKLSDEQIKALVAHIRAFAKQ